MGEKENMKKTKKWLKILCLIPVGLVIVVIAALIISDILEGDYDSYVTSDITIDYEHSYVKPAKIVDGKVYVFCNYIIENNSDHAVRFQLLGDFTTDYGRGLFTQEMLVGYRLGGEVYETLSQIDPKTMDVADTPVMEVPPHDWKEVYVVYVGEWGGKAKKQFFDKMLPRTTIVEVFS